MKSKILYAFMGVLLASSLSVGTAFAQKAPMTQDRMKPAPMSGAAAGERSDLAMNHRGSDFMNKSVKDDKGETLGTVKDFVFDRDGDLSYIIVASAGAEDKMIPIPFTEGMFKFQEDSVIVSNLDKTKLEKAPTFSSAEWSKLDDPAFESRVHGYYREGGAMKGGAAGQDMKTTPGAGTGSTTQKNY